MKFRKFLFLFLIFGATSCNNKKNQDVNVPIQQESEINSDLYLSDFYCTSSFISNGVDNKHLIFEKSIPSFDCEALVINSNHDSFVDIVVYTSWNNKHAVYNEGNGDFVCSSTTEYDGSIWKTKINFNIPFDPGHSQNGTIEIEEISFLSMSSTKAEASLGNKDKKKIEYHEHWYTVENASQEALYQSQNHLHANRYYYSCSCGLTENHLFNSNSVRYFETKEGPIPHVFDRKVAESVYLAHPATCTTSAQYYYSCSCGAHNDQVFSYGGPLGHSFSNFTYNKDETFDNDGTKSHRCSRCGLVETFPADGSALKNGSLQNLEIDENGTIRKYKRYYYDERDNHVIIPDSVKSIGNSAFLNATNIETIQIPNTVVSILDKAFQGCSGLTFLDIPDSVLYIGDYAFSNCTNLIDFTLSHSLISLGAYAFNYCSNLKSINLPLSLQTIDSSSFYGCSGIVLCVEAESRPSTWPTSFSGCSISGTYYGILKAVFTDDHLYGVFNNNGIKELSLIRGKSDANIVIPDHIEVNDELLPVTQLYNSVFSWNSTIVSVSLPSTIKEISQSCFFYCGKLETINIPQSVRKIGTAAFLQCASLKEIVLPDGLDIINSSCFSGCTSLEKINIPETVNEIAFSAFNNCKNLKFINIPTSVTTIGNSAFSGCTSLIIGIKNSSSVMTLGSDWNKNVFGTYFSCVNLGNDNGFSYVILEENNNKSIAIVTYNGSEKNLDIPSYFQINGESVPVTSIEANAFKNKGLLSVSIPQTIKSVGYRAFEDNYSLESVKFNHSPAIIGQCAFYNCKLLKYVDLSDSIVEIGNLAFGNCKEIKTFFIPKSVSNIHLGAFYSATCRFLCQANSKPQLWDSYAFMISGSSLDSPVRATPIFGCVRKDNFVYSLDSTLLEASILGSVFKITSTNLIIPSSIEIDNQLYSVTDIADSAFNGHTEIVSINFPHTLTSIQKNAFAKCSGLVNLVFPDQLTYLGDYSFQYCTSLLSVIIPEGIDSIKFLTFNGCSSLVSIYFPMSVTAIGTAAFQDCSAKLFFANSKADIEGAPYNGIYSCTLNSNIIFTTESNAKVVGVRDFLGANSLEIPSVITVNEIDYVVDTISSDALNGCSNLTYIKIPETVTTIESGAFTYCSSLETIALSANSNFDLSLFPTYCEIIYF